MVCGSWGRVEFLWSVSWVGWVGLTFLFFWVFGLMIGGGGVLSFGGLALLEERGAMENRDGIHVLGEEGRG